MVTANQIPNSSDGNSKRKKKNKEIKSNKNCHHNDSKGCDGIMASEDLFWMANGFFFYSFFGSVYKSGEALLERVQIEIRV